MIISDILRSEGIEVNLKSQTKEDVLIELVDLLEKANMLDDNKEIIRNAIFEREKLSSTGICDGLAIPHAKVSGIKNILGGIGISKEGIDFQALDKKLSKIFFILISPKEDHGNHVKALAKITKILKEESWREELMKCPGPQEVLDFIKDKEKNII